MQRLNNRLDSPKLSGFKLNSFKRGKNSKGNDNSGSNSNLTSLSSSENSSRYNIVNQNFTSLTAGLINNIWENLSIPLEDAVVYLDTAILQVLKYSSETGVDMLYENGAINVKDINKVSENENEIIGYDNNNNGIYIKYPETKKIVFILSSYLNDYEIKIKNILLNNAYQECHIYTSISESSHNLRIQRETPNQDRDLGSIAFQYLQGNDDGYFSKFQNKLKQWINMGNEIQQTGLAVEHMIYTVEYLPLLWSLYTSNLFLLPSGADVFPYMNTIQYKNVDHIEGGIQLSLLPPEEQNKIYRISSALSSLLEGLNVKDELFAIGETAHLIAREIVSHSSSSSRKKSERTASLILIDRTLDIGTPVRHLDNSLDKIYSILTRVSPHSYDLNITSDYLINNRDDLDNLTPIKCSFTHQMDQSTLDFIDSLQKTKSKEGLILIKKKLLDILKREMSSFKTPAPEAENSLVDQIKSFLDILKTNEMTVVKYSTMLECISAIIEADEDYKCSKWEELLGFEKILPFSLVDINDNFGIVQHISEVLNNLVQRSKALIAEEMPGFDIEDIIELIVFIYSLLKSSFSENEESFEMVKHKVLQTIIEIEGNRFVDAFELERFITSIFNNIQYCLQSKNLLSYNQNDLSSFHNQITVEPLVKTIASDILNGNGNSSPMNSNKTNGYNPNSINYIPYGQTLSHFFSGIGRRRQNQPSPNQNDILIFFVIGGITFSEVNELMEIAEQYNTKIIIGSTDIATGKTIYSNLYEQNDINKIKK
ncbi:hypothetical protein LY90DRAFT_675392 [Neocallimastix californiae]|jgi:hypothetical protein|uniref:Sec1-like protein n=1 Tax=Neocallimastix californiae TaxID=1754190 RepID=A0A1Y2ANQ6_9FUNG|nr:hypothetical protein LY90DRAFT_675392 [Neocallimastix californiae]|eukprot:ORY23847.1 hypothetical protein LY90DRAFT_675392 [Neocallimastix californiae]